MGRNGSGGRDVNFKVLYAVQAGECSVLFVAILLALGWADKSQVSGAHGVVHLLFGETNKIMALKLTTINCKGLRNFNKRDVIFERCRQTGTDILFLQEAHIVCGKEINNWNLQWGGKGFWSFGSEHSRGVGILLHRQLDYKFVHFKHDFEGRLLVLDIDLGDCKIRLINVYCPNDARDRKEFLDNLQVYLACSRKIILGGTLILWKIYSWIKREGMLLLEMWGCTI